ncbi:hypothetical protein EP7_000502 [Isosphaeraceae bacterium EP7]
MATVLLGILPAIGPVAPSPARSAEAPRKGAKVLYHQSRTFRIPVNIVAADKPRIKEVQLCVSSDSGYTWTVVNQISPDRPAFTFKAIRDAEYWFATRVLDADGKLFPPDDRKVEPGMKVIVDTTPPLVTLDSRDRRGSVASVTWEVKDANLDLTSLTLEYQAEGAVEWRTVPLRRPALIGGEKWDAGTAEPLRVRLRVSDKAKNEQTASLTMPYGGAIPPAASSSDDSEYGQPPSPILPISSGSEPRQSVSDAQAGSGPTLDESSPFYGVVNQGAQAPPVSQNPDPVPTPAAPPVAASPTPAPAPTQAPVAAGNGKTMLVASPRFSLEYAVDDAGPNGPETVELWITNDGGRNWSRRPEDPDRASPYPVDLGGEGTFGLCLVARSANGLGDLPPAPGDPPQTWVEVDSTPPAVQLDPPAMGAGANVGKLTITWRASDLHLASRPVVLSYRPVGSNAPWQPISAPMENTQQFTWTLPANIPPRFHIRVDVIDTVGNLGSAETTDMGPVFIDRARPRSRIIGLDPSARGNTSARPLR